MTDESAPDYTAEIIALLEAHLERTPPKEIFERDPAAIRADYDPAVRMAFDRFETATTDPLHFMALVNGFALVWQITASTEFDGLSHRARFEKLRAVLSAED